MIDISSKQIKQNAIDILIRGMRIAYSKHERAYLEEIEDTGGSELSSLIGDELQVMERHMVRVAKYLGYDTANFRCRE